MFSNPVLRGCYPDPSVTRVGSDYFLVTSSFEYLPGLPIFRSADLVNWVQVGAAIAGEGQVDLSTVPSSGGLYAATLRHHDGTFYITNTVVHGEGRKGNFIVTATDIAGPWSDPVWLDDAAGIDPSLFFDADGRAWFHATRLAEPGEWPEQTEVWLRGLDLTTLQLVGPEYILWTGALIGAVWAEGPHLYRVGEYYYLLAAEGGTEHNHAVSIARSESVTGPYVGNPGNPVLTHRTLGREYPVVGVGHADLVQTPSGEWWSVLLGSRPYGGYFPNLGRETHLVPVTWEDGWPVFAPGTGRVEASFAAPNHPLAPPFDAATDASGFAATNLPDTGVLRDDFDGETLAPTWNGVRAQPTAVSSLTARPGWLRLPLVPATLAEVAVPAFVGRRQQHQNARFSAHIDFAPGSGSEGAGLAVRQSEDAHLTLLITAGDSGERRVVATSRVRGLDTVIGDGVIPAGPLTLTVRAAGQDYHLEYETSSGIFPVAVADASELSSPRAGGFLGLWWGLYATSHGAATSAHADIDWTEYVGADG